MKLILATAVTLATLGAQPNSRGHETHQSVGPPGETTVMTGCFGQDHTGNFVITEAGTGVLFTVTGPASLQKHDKRQVRLTGIMHYDTSGHDILEVNGIHDVAASCSE